jgi:hypothetical protein
MADYWAGLATGQKLWPWDHDLRALPKPGPWRRLRRHPHHWQVQDRTGERQNNEGWQIDEVVSLDHERWTRLAGVTLQGDGYEVAALHGQSGSAHASPASASQKAISSRPTGLASHSANSRACRPASAANPGALVSGTQIWTERRPIARIFSRRRRTVAAEEERFAVMGYM